jgi:hypothetical protein
MAQKPAAAAPAAVEAALKKGAPAAAAPAKDAEVHLTKRPDLKRVESAGLVSNDSIQEDEVEKFFAPEAALEEEERLRKEREDAEAAADPPPTAEVRRAAELTGRLAGWLNARQAGLL